MDFPKPFVIPPHTLPHKQTFILLHGRGSNGEKFGTALVTSPFQATTLALAFPHARFVLPTACLRRATIYRRALTRQWFDNWSLEPPGTEREELQVPGLCETTAYLHDLWRREVGDVPGGAANVVVGGLSQGCAATLVALLLWEGENFGAMVGMCGWLPFSAQLNEHLLDDGRAQSWDDEFDPFERADDLDLGVKLDPSTQAIIWLCEELDTPVGSTASRHSLSIPIFLGHGTKDEKVSIVLGRQSSDCLRDLGADLCWKEYEALGHWYSEDLLRDLAQFVQTKAKWPTPVLVE